MSYNWNEKSVLFLIKRYHESELLWNTRHPDYENQVERVALFRSIASELGTRSDVEKKLKSLSSRYYKERKFYERRVDALGPYAPKPKWFAYKALNFLLHKHLPPQSNLDVEGANDEYQVGCTEVTSSNEEWEISQSADITPKRQTTPSDPVDTNRDEAAVFGEYIAVKIRRMDPVTATMVQHRIQNIIYEVDMASFAAEGLVPPAAASKASTGAASGAADDDCGVPMPIKCEYGFPEDEPVSEQ